MGWSWKPVGRAKVSEMSGVLLVGGESSSGREVVVELESERFEVS